MLSRTTETPLWLETRLGNRWRTFELITFVAFMGSLVTLLVLLYSDVPIVGFLTEEDLSGLDAIN